MILVQRTALFIRGYRTQALSQRVNQLLKFVNKHSSHDPSPDSPWSSVSKLPTLDSAVAHIESLALPSAAHSENHHLSPPSLDAVQSPPTWLLVELCSKVRSPTDAQKVSHLIITYLPHIPSELRPPVLILVAHFLSAYRLLPALERIIKLFIGLPLFRESWHFNRLLRTLSLYTDNPNDGRYIARLAILLLKTMTDRELSLTRETYRLLLRNRYVTMELAEKLRDRMIRDRIVPDRAHLESLLRIFAHRGTVHDAAAYARAIHHLDPRRDKPPHQPVSNRPGPAKTNNQTAPSTTVQYLTHLVYENSKRTQFNADVEWSRFLNSGHSPRFLNKQNDSAVAWAARLVGLSRTRSFSPESLVAFFDWSHAQRFPFRTHSTISYTIVLRGLLRKRAYTLALEVWERYRKHGQCKLHLDLIALGTGVEVLVRAGHPEGALALLDMYRARPIPTRLSLRERSTTVPMSLVNRFMRVLSTTNPSAALRLWDYMHILYDSSPDARAFTTMLVAARHATLNGESFAGAMQELGFSFRLPFTRRRPPVGVNRQLDERPSSSDATAGAESLDGARSKILAKLRKSFAVDEGDMWGAERAWRRAHRTFTNALLAGWPELNDVRPPARAVRASGESPATAPLRDLKHFLLPPNVNVNTTPHSSTPPLLHHHAFAPTDIDDPDPDLHTPPLLPIQPRGAYLSFAPDDPTFRAAILLLGTVRAAGEIPLMLAWMRALGITPHRRTLAYALVFWAEVSVGAPLLERFRSRGGGGGSGGGVGVGQGQGEYVRLLRWMEEWVGAENVPDEAEVGEAMRRVDLMRRGRDRSEDPT